MFIDPKKSLVLLLSVLYVAFFFNRQDEADQLEPQEGRDGRGEIGLPLKAQGLKAAAN